MYIGVFSIIYKMSNDSEISKMKNNSKIPNIFGGGALV
jgi:hypothetical protein